MTLRLPRPHARKPRENALDYQIAHEQAAALGRLGRALEAALAALSRHDRSDAERRGGTAKGGSAPLSASASAARERLLQEAAYALWCLLIQREACGLRDRRLMVRDYDVPRKVQNRMGACSSAPLARLRRDYSRFLKAPPEPFVASLSSPF